MTWQLVRLKDGATLASARALVIANAFLLLALFARRFDVSVSAGHQAADQEQTAGLRARVLLGGAGAHLL